jgi:hypothetical protein
MEDGKGIGAKSAPKDRKLLHLIVKVKEDIEKEAFYHSGMLQGGLRTFAE